MALESHEATFIKAILFWVHISHNLQITLESNSKALNTSLMWTPESVRVFPAGNLATFLWGGEQHIIQPNSFRRVNSGNWQVENYVRRSGNTFSLSRSPFDCATFKFQYLPIHPLSRRLDGIALFGNKFWSRIPRGPPITKVFPPEQLSGGGGATFHLSLLFSTWCFHAVYINHRGMLLIALLLVYAATECIGLTSGVRRRRSFSSW